MRFAAAVKTKDWLWIDCVSCCLIYHLFSAGVFSLYKLGEEDKRDLNLLGLWLFLFGGDLRTGNLTYEMTL